MNAVSIRQPDAAALLAEQEPASYAGWQTSHRGPLLIHAAKRHPGMDLSHQAPGLVYNPLIGVADLADCVQDDHLGADPDEVGYLWVLTSPVSSPAPSTYTARQVCSRFPATRSPPK